MKQRILTVTMLLCLLIGMNGFTGSGKGENKDTGVQYQILPRGVQDFSDGEVTMVESPIEIVPGDEYYTVSGAYYGCLIKRQVSGNFLKIEIGDASIAYELPGEQPFGKVKVVEGVLEEKKDRPKSFSYKGISEDLDLRYTFSHHKVLEEFVLSKFRHVRIVERFEMEKVWYSVKEDGIHFYHVETGEEVFFIPEPVMYEEGNPLEQCKDIHYEVKRVGDRYVIEKVIDEKGIEWLKSPERVYPVIIDSTTQGGFTDPWEESGLVPYGQYFKNLNEYVSPANGGLTVKQTDLYLPGRGMDVAITRIYTTPQSFQLDSRYPTEYTPTEEDPPWKIANGWRFDFPGITENYLYLWDGRMYKIEWDNDPPDCPYYWCRPPTRPEEKVFSNHKGDHFRLIKHVDGTYTLYVKDGRVIQFSDLGVIQWIRDDNGNEIHFSTTVQSDGEGHVTILSAVITDTIGRTVTLSPGGVSYEQWSVNYNIQYVQNAKGEYDPLLGSVTDGLGRITSYFYDYTFFDGTTQVNRSLLTKVVYPTQGRTEYTYGRKEVRYCKETCDVWNQDCHTVTDCYNRLYQFLVITQKVYADTLSKVRTFSYTGDWENTFSSTEKTKDEQEYVQTTTYFSVDDGKVLTKTLKDCNGVQIEKIEYKYNAQGETILSTYYKGNTNDPTYQEFSSYDDWGNQIYSRNSLGYETFSSYVNTSSEDVFKDYSGNTVSLFSNSFFTNDFGDWYVHDKMAGSCTLQDGSAVESYYLYDGSGNMIETKDIFEGKSYTVFRGLFDENGQKTFSFLLNSLPSSDAYLSITGLPTQNMVQKSETHSVSLHRGYHNTGYWRDAYFYAHWIYGLDGEGYDPVGPFTHYPGTPGYQSYTLWVEGRVQYVKTNYQVYENILPLSCSYRLNNTSWTQITPNLGNGTAQIVIPKEKFSLQNALEFSESSNYKTRYSWTLFVPVEAQPEVYHRYFSYDMYGNMTSAQNCYGTVLFEYGEEYNSAYMTRVTDPLQNTISATYDTMGNITSITDAKGYTYQYEYDLLNRLKKKVNPDLTEREAVYDDTNNVVTIYDELDHSVKKYFDRLGRIIKIETNSGLYTELYTYNYQDKVETRTDPLGRVYTYEYDVLGRILKTHNLDGTLTQWVYNNLDNTVETFDENLNKTGYKYDWVGNLLWVKEYIDQSYYLTEYEYDEFGNLLKAKDAKGNTTSYLYGMFGIERILYPNNTEETFTYDCIGNVIEKTSGDRVIHYQYNSASQLVRVEYPDSFVSFMYDENGNRTTMENSDSSTAYVYDSRNRLLSETKTIDSINYTTSYEYDAASNVISLSYPDGTVITHVYDNLNRLTSVDGYAQFLWNENSQLEQILYQNNILTDYLYDLRGRPIQIKSEKNGSDLLNLTYTYDPAGNILQMKNQDAAQVIKEQWNYTYDTLNRLKTATGGPSGQNYSLNYQYDSTWNRIQLNGTLYAYNEMNELLSSGSTNGNCTFTYDLYGNCIRKEDGTNIWEYTYDCENRLISVKKNGQTVEQYVYDGDGKRIKKSDATSERVYIYGGLNVLYEVNVTAQMDAVYIYGPTGRIAKKVNDIQEYYQTDHLGSTRLVASENGEITEEIQYEPFGEQINAAEERYTYNGKERDETGLYYYGARYYDPTVGRFISRDPLIGEKESPQTLNRYVYCLNNPLTYTDPAGTKGVRAQDIVEEIFARLQSVDPDELAEIQEALNNKSLTLIDALIKILDLLGFAHKTEDGNLMVDIGDNNWFGMNLVENLRNEHGLSCFGITDNNNKVISLNLSISKVGDLALTLLHEVCHGTLGADTFGEMEKEHSFIYGVEVSYMEALNAFDVAFSSNFKTSLAVDASRCDPRRIHRVPIVEISEKWLRWRKWKKS